MKKETKVKVLVDGGEVVEVPVAVPEAIHKIVKDGGLTAKSFATFILNQAIGKLSEEDRNKIHTTYNKPQDPETDDLEFRVKVFAKRGSREEELYDIEKIIHSTKIPSKKGLDEFKYLRKINIELLNAIRYAMKHDPELEENAKIKLHNLLKAYGEEKEGDI